MCNNCFFCKREKCPKFQDYEVDYSTENNEIKDTGKTIFSSNKTKRQGGKRPQGPKGFWG